MQTQFSRAQLVFGAEGMRKLSDSRVIIFGIGGVGGYVVEALARGGVGALDIVDNDTVSLTNLNRQLVATHSSLGTLKVECAKERILDINPNCNVKTYTCFYLPDTANQFDFSQYDYVIDAVDTVTAKLLIITEAKKAKVPIISCMGTGNKIDPTQLKVTTIKKTENDRLARIIRKECRKRGIDDFKVVCSSEPSRRPDQDYLDYCRAEELKQGATLRRDTPGSTSFIPGIAGLMLAGEVIKDLVGV